MTTVVRGERRTKSAALALAAPSRLRAGIESLLQPIAAAGAEGDAAPSDQAQRARLLAALSLCLIGLCGTGAIQVYVFTPEPLASGMGAILLGTVVAFSVAYRAARRGVVALAVSIIVTAQAAVPVAMYILVGRPTIADSTQAAAWMVLPVLTANAILGSRAVLAVGAFTIVSLTGAEVIVGASTHQLANGALFIFTITVAVYAYTRHRDQLETSRQVQLRRHNEQLVDLQKTLEDRVEQRTRDLAASADALRDTYENLQNNQILLVRAEKMAAVGRLTAGLAHELASPLGAVLAATESLKELRDEYASSIGDEEVTSEDHHAIACEMAVAIGLSQQAARRAVTFVRGIRSHTRDPGAAAAERFDLRQVASEAVDLLGYLARAAKVSVELEMPSSPVLLTGVPSRVNQAITNLVHNAIDAVGETGCGGAVTVTISDTRGGAVISVADDGPGILPSVLARVFEPLFTTKAYGKGTGLGLAIVAEIVQAELGGEIKVETSVGSGTTFVVRLPGEGAARGA